MELSTLLIILLGAALAGFVQGLSGFGFAVTAISIWAWVLEPQLTAALGVFGAFAGQVFSVATVRRGFDAKRLAPFLLGAIAGMPAGVWLLPRLDVPMFKALLGLILIVTCPLMLLASRLPRVSHGGRVADGIAGAIGGVMGGLGGSTGLVPTLWCTLRGFAKDEQRSIIQNFNLAALGITFASYVATGIATRDMVPYFAALVPAMILPSLAGRRLYLGISEQGFRQVVLGLLTFSGLAMLASALPVLLARGS
ncbi:MAG TPA: sulfite exporter TauE/SafE family protein [Ramlibacter sp.]|uniref:sulfite exporter TauE/SafE family protein n=1 Tax=Ramlibacter sp. TaxID=1917967 RepID=UPI002C35E705|nr:sulfite exporter TauE/SafE family protein [Ramlibacter sp.]HVZ45516.1 sulfite exporter TauE/SafE family protein [Ramlibacter sp.]